MADAKKKCAATLANVRTPDFHCALADTAHTVHVDPRTGERWGTGGPPRGMRRKYAKKYTNPKLARHARQRGTAGR